MLTVPFWMRFMKPNIYFYEKAKELLSYNDITGEFCWKASRGRVKSGDIAGTLSGKGYLQVSILGKRLYLHRVAWYFVHGEEPAETIDHINRNKTDNRVSNLRKASKAENNKNVIFRSDNSSGHRGVRFKNGRWISFIQIDGKPRYLGSFSSLKEASEEYATAAKRIYGNFSPFN